MSASWGDVSDTSPASPLELPASPLEDAPPLECMESPLELSVSDTSLEDAPLEGRLDDTIAMGPAADSPTRARLDDVLDDAIGPCTRRPNR